MRLIDADLLIQDLHHGIFYDCDCKKDYEYLGIDDYIGSQPTAFDFESVITELKERLCDKEDEKRDVECAMRNKHFREAIEILNSAVNAMNGGV